MARLFEGLKVIDCGSFIAAPTAAVLLGDFGADVIKVEPPGAGDPCRALPHLPGMPRSDQPYGWMLDNRNKRDLALDLFWVNRYPFTMYGKQPMRWRDVPRQRDDVFLPIFQPWESAEPAAAIESGYRNLVPSWDEGTEDKIFRILLDVFRHKKGAGAELSPLKSTVAEILANRVPRQEEYIARVPAIAILPWFLAGALFPITALPIGLTWFAKFLPLTHGLAVMRYGLLGDGSGLHAIWGMTSPTAMAALSLAIVSAFAAFLTIASIRVFSRSAVN